MTTGGASPEPVPDAGAVSDSGSAQAKNAGVANSGIINGDVTTAYHEHHYREAAPLRSEDAAPVPPRIRRRALFAAVGLVSASAVGALGYTAWRTNTGTGPVEGVLIEQDFGGSSGGWPLGVVEHGVQEYAAGDGYRIRTTTGDSPVWVTAPLPGQAVSAIRLAAAATIHAGNSGWGVWYHNTITGTRYEFSLTHDGFAYIKIHGGLAEPSWEPVQHFKTGQKNHLVAECRVTQQGVQLDLTINDEPRPERLHQNQLLGRGTIGLHAFHFKPKKKADIQFHDFKAVRL